MSATSTRLLLDFYANLLAATAGILEDWRERRGTLEPSCLERALTLVGKMGGSLLDALPFLRLC